MNICKERRQRILLTALARCLDEDGEVFRGLTVPRGERLEELETVRGGADGDLDAGTVSGRRLEGVLSGVISARRKLIAVGLSELERLAIRTGQAVSERVEGERSTEGHGSNDIG